MNFEQAIKDLEDIVKKLEGGELTLEESMNLFEKGVALSNACSKMERWLSRNLLPVRRTN